MFGKVNKNEFFSVHSYYEELRGNDAMNFPWKSNTEGQGSFDVAFFVWMACWGRILTIDNLIKDKMRHLIVN